MASHRTERVFCISIRKDIDTGYTFPSPVESDTVLMDKLEPVEDIDEKYFRNTVNDIETKVKFGSTIGIKSSD